MAISIENYSKKPSQITYWRNPTKEDIKFGHGATHYRDFEFEKCFDENGILKLKMIASDDKLIYYYCGQEYFTASKAKLKTMLV